MYPWASQVEAPVEFVIIHFLQGLLDQTVRDGQVGKGSPSKFLLEGETLPQLLLGILVVVDQRPESDPDVPGFAGLPQEELGYLS